MNTNVSINYLYFYRFFFYMYFFGFILLLPFESRKKILLLPVSHYKSPLSLFMVKKETLMAYD